MQKAGDEDGLTGPAQSRDGKINAVWLTLIPLLSALLNSAMKLLELGAPTFLRSLLLLFAKSRLLFRFALTIGFALTRLGFFFAAFRRRLPRCLFLTLVRSTPLFFGAPPRFDFFHEVALLRRQPRLAQSA